MNQRTIRQAGRVTEVRYISERTEWDYRQYARALGKMFCSLTLAEIHLGHIREYHRARAFKDGAWDRPAGANRIRKEVGMLTRILRSAGLWAEKSELATFFQPIARVESDVQRAMEPDQQEHFLAVAASHERWHYIRNYTVAALQTTASTNEMRGLRIADVMLEHGFIQIRWASAKNKFRIRSIPIETQECHWAFEALRYRAHSLGASAPHHYLFPAQEARYHYDPNKPMSDSGLKKSWDEVRQAAGMTWLRPYDLRHTGITRMAEAGIPIPVILSFAGHISVRMQQHYTTISLMAKRKAASSTWSKGAPAYMGGVRPAGKFSQNIEKIS